MDRACGKHGKEGTCLQIFGRNNWNKRANLENLGRDDLIIFKQILWKWYKKRRGLGSSEWVEWPTDSCVVNLVKNIIIPDFFWVGANWVSVGSSRRVDRVAQLVQRLATGWTVRGSNPGGSEIFRTCADRPWETPSLLYNGYRVFPGGIKRPGLDAEPSPPSVP
jgi:hypothetical protein